MATNCPTERILLTGTAPGGDRVDLVAYGINRCGIFRNGLPEPNAQWDLCDLEESTLALARALGFE